MFFAITTRYSNFLRWVGFRHTLYGSLYFSGWSSSSWPNGSDNIVKQEAQAKQQPPNSDEKDQKIASLEALLQELRKVSLCILAPS